MKNNLFLVLISLIVLIWGINLYFYTQLHKPSIVYIVGPEETTTTTIPENVTIVISKSCNSDSDCSWQTTNCCPENAGAYWQCINEKKSEIKCIGTILCPQINSSKPVSSCECKQGECVG